MDIKNCIFIVLMLFFCVKAPSKSYNKELGGITSTYDGVDVNIKFFTDDIVHISKNPCGNFKKKNSLTVVICPSEVNVSVKDLNSHLVELSSSKLVVKYDTSTGRVSFFDINGKELLTEKDYGTQFTPRSDGKVKSYWVRQAFMLEANEPIYGLGQQQTGKMNQRGQRLELMQRNKSICIPFFQSIKGYGVYWDNYSPTIFEDNLQETSFSSEVGDCSDYYFLYGGTCEGVVKKIRQLTGEVPMMPLWSAGYMQCKAAYESSAELLDVVHRYRNMHIPFDVIIQDWHYWGDNNNWNSMSFDTPQYKDAQAMIDEVHKNNAKFMISIWPSFGPNTKQYKEFKANDMLYHGIVTWPNDGAEIYDAFNPRARDIYWKYAKHLYDMGTDAWWTDATEPEQYREKETDFEVPTYLGTFRRMRNAYPLMTNKGLYEHLRKAGSPRTFIMTRSGFLGLQHYGAAVWSGDVWGCWDHFKKQIPAGVNYSMTGLPYWNTDIGGWDSWLYPKGVSDPAYRELHLRWFQYGTFTPIMRSHNYGCPVEVYRFGKPGDLAYDVMLKYIKIRYRLLPYIYGLMGGVTFHSGMILRGLPMDFPQDSTTFNLEGEYLFGKSILVAPVTDSLYTARTEQGTSVDMKEAKNWTVYLPKGVDWYDIWTTEKFRGGQTIEKKVPMDVIPIYVRAGSIIPLGPDVEYAGEKKWDDLEIRVYPGNNGKFTLYEDEGVNYNYEEGAYSEITFLWNDSQRLLTISPRKGRYKNMLSRRTFHITICDSHNTRGFSKSSATKAIKYDGKRLCLKF